jgi:hypothetical protein
MTGDEIREHIERRAQTPKGTIRRRTVEHLPGDHRHGEVIQDVQPIALAFIAAVHGTGCDCVHCSCGR